MAASTTLSFRSCRLPGTDLLPFAFSCLVPLETDRVGMYCPTQLLECGVMLMGTFASKRGYYDAVRETEVSTSGAHQYMQP